jgi:hypothetical protein
MKPSDVARRPGRFPARLGVYGAALLGMATLGGVQSVASKVAVGMVFWG